MDKFLCLKFLNKCETKNESKHCLCMKKNTNFNNFKSYSEFQVFNFKELLVGI